jgi:hypothetical protein
MLLNVRSGSFKVAPVMHPPFQPTVGAGTVEAKIVHRPAITGTRINAHPTLALSTREMFSGTGYFAKTASRRPHHNECVTTNTGAERQRCLQMGNHAQGAASKR